MSAARVRVTMIPEGPVQASEGAELPPLTEAEIAEIEARRAAHEIEIRGCLCTSCVPNLATLFTEASEDAGRLLTDLRRAWKRIADLEAHICDAVDHGELSPNSERRGLLNKRAAERGEVSE